MRRLNAAGRPSNNADRDDPRAASSPSAPSPADLCSRPIRFLVMALCLAVPLRPIVFLIVGGSFPIERRFAQAWNIPLTGFEGDVPDWIAEFVRFQHRPDTPDTQYLVWVPFCCGIGDRVRAMVSVFYLALATGRKLRLFDPDSADALRPAFFDWTRDVRDLIAGSDHEVVFGNYLSPDLYKFADGQFDRFRTVVVNTNVAFWPLIMNTDNFADLLRQRNIPSGNWTGGAEELLYTWAWNVLARPTEIVRHDVAALRRRHGLDGGFIAVHIRRGGHWGDEQRHDEIAPFAQCLGDMVAEVGALPAYVASDDAATRARFSEMVPVPVVHDDADPYHVSSSRERDLLRRLRAWAEFFLMSEAACVVASRSGFSEWPIAMTRDPWTGARCYARFDHCSREAVAASRQRLVPMPIWPAAYPPGSLSGSWV